jgi:hypothetical protein
MEIAKRDLSLKEDRGSRSVLGSAFLFRVCLLGLFDACFACICTALCLHVSMLVSSLMFKRLTCLFW